MSNKEKKRDTLEAFALKLRGKGGIRYGHAKMEMEMDSTRVEFFRAKDAVRYFTANPDLLDSVGAKKPGRTLEEQIADLMQLLIKRKLVYRTDRKFTKPKPGKKNLVKFPKTLVQLPTQEAIAWQEDGLYVWAFDRPTSPWFYFFSVLLVIGVVLVTLFPLAPYAFRMYSVYTLMGILMFLLGLIGIRYVLWLAAWIVTGRSFWFLPNLTSDDVGIYEALWPVVTFTPLNGGKYNLLYRLAAMLICGGIIYSLYYISPEQAKLRSNAQKAHNSLLEFLETFGKQEKQQLSGGAGADAPKTEL